MSGLGKEMALLQTQTTVTDTFLKRKRRLQSSENYCKYLQMLLMMQP